MFAVLLYFALGAVFAIAGSLSFRKGGLRLLALTATLTAAVLLVAGLWYNAPHDETDIRMPILLALMSPTLTALAILGLRKSTLRPVVQWFIGTLAWALGFVVTGFAALSFNWITF